MLVGSYDPDSRKSTMAVWDFLDGRREYFCKSVVPYEIIQAKWNPYVEDEFVTITSKGYHYWRLTKSLKLLIQQGEMKKDFAG